MLTIQEYEAKREARYSRLIAASQRAAQESESSLNQSRQMSDCIPLGQPILVGHYSENRDRNFRERIHNKARRGFELRKRAEELASRAESAASNDAIYSDNPEAVDLLGDKVAELEKLQARYKAINAAHAKFLKNPASLDKPDLSEADKKLVREWKPNYSFERHPIQPYKLTNLSATIRNAKKRAEKVERLQTIPDKDEQVGDVKIEWRASENRIRLYYPGRVPRETFDFLRQHGFRALHSVGEGAFSAYYNSNALYFIQTQIKKG